MENYTPPTDPYLEIIFSDDHLLVLNKQSGLLSVPGRIFKDSLASRAQEQFPTATVVHRLDMETSGIMLMALNMDAHRNFSRQFQQRTPKKTYVAEVEGQVIEDEGEIDLPLICDWPNRPRQIVDHENGKPSLTRWQVEKRHENGTRLQLFPVTGRSHQLRVHCQSMGHPIIADPLYGYVDFDDPNFMRMQLHAETLTMHHPVTGEEVTFKAPLPF